MVKETQDSLMVRYLLGDLPQSEQAALEDLLFTSNEAFERMWASENRLVDDYVRGRLASSSRIRFEEHYLASPIHRHRVTIARDLLASADQSLVDSEKHSLLERLRTWSEISYGWRLAMAAALLMLCAGAIWLLIEQSRLRSQVAGIQKENAMHEGREQELSRRVAEQQAERGRLEAELGNLRNRQPQQPQAPQPPQPNSQQAPIPRPSLTVFSFTLSPVSVRGTAGQTIALGSEADQVQLRMAVPLGELKSFAVTIQTAERELVWSQRQIKPRAGQVIVNVPSDRLPFNDYILTLSGVDIAGHPLEINRYSFRVVRE
jgi:hypothetical protein